MADLNNREAIRSYWWKKPVTIFTQSKTPTLSLIILYLVMVLIFSLSSPHYFTVTNFKSIISNLAVDGILAAGVVIVMIAGGFDLSVGSLMGLVGVFIAKLFRMGIDIPILVIILIALCIGPLLGLINGLIITKVGINPIITTLGTLAIFRGICYMWADQVARIYNYDYILIGQGWLANLIPYSFIYLIIFFVVLALILKFTRFGRNLYTVGGNEYLARLAGINTEKIKLMSYVISGLFCSFAAIVLTARLGSGRPEYGTGAELDVLTIAVLGGVAVGGGKGNYLGTFIALLIIGSISNGLVLLDVPVFLRMVIKGALLILAVSIDALRNRRRLQLY